MSFHSLQMSFGEQIFLILKSDLVTYYYMDCAFDTTPENSLSNTRSQRLLKCLALWRKLLCYSYGEN